MLDLPEPSTEQLPRSPLELVVCQVRHERNVAVLDPKRALSVHDLIRFRYPEVEEITEQELNIAGGPKGIQSVSSTTSNGWRFKSSDGVWTVALVPEYYSLETSEYADWDDFRARFEELTKAVAQNLEPSLEQRLGMRFIDRIFEPEVEKPEEWKSFIDPHLLGPVLHPALGLAVEASQQQLQIDAGEGMLVVLRHGFARDPNRDNRWVYFLDNDCFRRKGQPFDIQRVMEGAEQLHRLALQIFQASITPQLYAFLKEESS